MEVNTVIDLATFNDLKELMGADFILDLVDTYTLETGELLNQLRQALLSKDAASFGRIAHSIKSSSASLGALLFSQQARELEMLGKANDLHSAGPKLDQLDIDFSQVKQRLSELKHEP